MTIKCGCFFTNNNLLNFFGVHRHVELVNKKVQQAYGKDGALMAMAHLHDILRKGDVLRISTDYIVATRWKRTPPWLKLGSKYHSFWTYPGNLTQRALCEMKSAQLSAVHWLTPTGRIPRRTNMWLGCELVLYVSLAHGQDCTSWNIRSCIQMCQ